MEWLEWHRQRFKGKDVPDYLIETLGPGDEHFYCVHGCRNLAEHDALKERLNGNYELQRIAGRNP